MSSKHKGFISFDMEINQGTKDKPPAKKNKDPGGSDGKASAYNVGDPGAIPGSGRSPEDRNDNPHQYACLGNPVDRGA